MRGELLHFLKAPGFVRPMDEYIAGGVSLRVKTSPRYTILVVNGVEFFFNRESGKFDGYGAMRM